jgi:hypothetical protein
MEQSDSTTFVEFYYALIENNVEKIDEFLSSPNLDQPNQKENLQIHLLAYSNLWTNFSCNFLDKTFVKSTKASQISLKLLSYIIDILIKFLEFNLENKGI